MAGKQIPYMAGYGYITRTLNGIKTPATPERFTQDFLETKLGLKGGSPRPVIPFLKRTGFLHGDGRPTELYTQFRNASQTGAAAAKALKTGYAPLYELNEYVHDLDDTALTGVIVQATGWEESSQNVKNAVGSFKALNSFANFDAKLKESKDVGSDRKRDERKEAAEGVLAEREIHLGYTINLNLPPVSDIAVFNAIFKSLKEHLL
ncbi:Uncharacterised protein [Mycobacteroides abscessus]|uniref:DUF5343 domain-containing protein n=1 Tax=Mycobacteroides abscessus TaxID=36809 RepID=UPI0005E6425C|nr:DUF5343 domain-containing protein [Mycobacteroides abscessus]RIS72375.1 hypothetical protein D2E70_05550 [Mycobacteroides abscessus]CPU27509.1 Uncharacterised protein [Mycobacteroides abscessus]CPX13963.1 Uncharacterised protein [Mycobacteroides abscessus]CQA08902.1 Uncharacterised protein [Mycobacteroides abscessus]